MKLVYSLKAHILIIWLLFLKIISPSNVTRVVSFDITVNSIFHAIFIASAISTFVHEILYHLRRLEMFIILLFNQMSVRQKSCFSHSSVFNRYIFSSQSVRLEQTMRRELCNMIRCSKFFYQFLAPFHC